MNKANSRVRLAVLIGILVVLFSVFAIRLLKFQIIDGEEYREMSVQGSYAQVSLKAVRGEVLDVNLEPIIANREGYSVVFYRAFMPQGEENDIILRLNDILLERGESHIDNLPISQQEPYAFTEGSDSAISRLKTFLDLQPYSTVENVVDALIERYDLQNYTPAQQRLLMGVRYEMEQRGFNNSTVYTFAEDISMETVTRIKENSHLLSGVEIEETPVRDYTEAASMPHIAGVIGPIYAEEYAELKEQGYQMNDTIGKYGVESVFEEYLRGINGSLAIAFDSKGNVLEQNETTPATPGNTVVLSIDNRIQKIAQQALEDQIQYLNLYGREGLGKETNGGCAIAVDVKTGKIICSVTAPTYTYEDYQYNYASLLDETLNSPLLNRPMMGLYAPGSSFKPVVSVAGLNEGVITPSTLINCTRVYRYFAPSYTPSCLGYHGNINVVGALRESCNYFYYETGRLLGIDNVSKYATMFGLGKKTGVEVPEATGHADSREYRKSAGYSYYSGDILQASIGQGYNFFTPIQLASYTATLANQGKRMKISLVDSIYSYNLDEKLYTFEPEVLDSFELDQTIWDTVKEGMVEVSRIGTAQYVFANYPYDVAAKTGTPETTSAPNAIFIAYAPADDPQIAVAVVLEKGYYGYNAGVVAKAIFDAYFFPDEPADPILPNSSGTTSSQMAQDASSAQSQTSSTASGSQSTAP